MTIRSFKIAFLGLFIACWAHPLNIIFDLGDVLVIPDRLAAFRQAGYAPFLAYLARHPHQISSIHNRVFEYLNTVHPWQPGQAQLLDKHNQPIPQLICQMMQNSKSSREILTMLRTYAKQHPEFFHSQQERRLIFALCKVIFIPKLFVSILKPVDPMVAFAKKCRQQGHKLYILSNLDAQSAQLFEQMHPELFKLFDGVVFSGNVGAIKPSPQPYQYLLATYNLNPADCIFIDDRPENLKMGEEFGIKGVLCRQTKTWYGATVIDVAGVRKDVRQIINQRKETSAAAAA